MNFRFLGGSARKVRCGDKQQPSNEYSPWGQGYHASSEFEIKYENQSRQQDIKLLGPMECGFRIKDLL